MATTHKSLIWFVAWVSVSKSFLETPALWLQKPQGFVAKPVTRWPSDDRVFGWTPSHHLPKKKKKHALRIPVSNMKNKSTLNLHPYQYLLKKQHHMFHPSVQKKIRKSCASRQPLELRRGSCEKGLQWQLAMHLFSLVPQPTAISCSAYGGGFTWVCLKIGYTPNYSHWIGIIIINHWV